MSGVMYSLVALGLVLIFKASGVFNFAQGAMVLFAALSVARIGEVDAAAGRVRAGRRHHGGARLADRATGAATPGQPGRRRTADGDLGVSYFLDGFGQTIWGSDIYKIDTGLPKTPVLVAEKIFEGGILINTEDLVAAAVAAPAGARAGAVFPEDADRPCAARSGRRSPGRAVDRHPVEPHLGHRLDGGRLCRAGGRR